MTSDWVVVQCSPASMEPWHQSQQPTLPGAGGGQIHFQCALNTFLALLGLVMDHVLKVESNAKAANLLSSPAEAVFWLTVLLPSSYHRLGVKPLTADRIHNFKFLYQFVDHLD